MAADIGLELYEQIKKVFEEKYEKAQLFGNPISDTLKKLETGEATFRDADMYAVEVGTMLSDSMVEVLKLEELPNETMYYNIAKKTIEPSLQTGYNLVSNVASAIQDDYNRKIGIGLKAAVPEYDTYRSDNIIEGAVKAKTQESLNAALQEPVGTFTRAVVDNTKKKNAEIHSKAGLEVKVTRIYDHVGLRRRTKHAEACSWCKERCGTDVSYKKAYAMGMFQRHNGCGCLIEYTSAKGEKTYSNSKYGWSTENPEREQRIEISTNIDKKRQLIKIDEIENKTIIGTEIKVKKIEEADYTIFVSEKATFKANDLHNLKKGIEESLNQLGIKYNGDLPTIVIADLKEMKGATGLYNPITNQLTFPDKIGNKGYMISLQKGKNLANYNNPFSTIKHELIHWDDAQKYKKEFGDITKENIDEYNAYRQRISLEMLDRAGINDYNIKKYGSYAESSYVEFDFDEAYTEYRVTLK